MRSQDTHDTALCEALRGLRTDEMLSLGVNVDRLMEAERRRRRRLRGATAVAVAAAASAAVIAAPTILPSGGGTIADDIGPATTSVSEQSLPTEEQSLPPEDQMSLIDDLYAWLDATYPDDLAYFSATGNHVTMWHLNLPDTAAPEFIRRVTLAGFTPRTRDLWQAYDDVAVAEHERIEAAGHAMGDIIDQHPDYSFTRLVSQVPLNTVVVWRTDADPQVEEKLQVAADRFSVAVELRDGVLTQAEANVLGQELRDRNDEWARQGFTVNGAMARGSGAVVVVRGDFTAARSALRDMEHVVSVVLDDGQNLPLTLPDQG